MPHKSKPLSCGELIFIVVKKSPNLVRVSDHVEESSGDDAYPYDGNLLMMRRYWPTNQVLNIYPKEKTSFIQNVNTKQNFFSHYEEWIL